MKRRLLLALPALALQGGCVSVEVGGEPAAHRHLALYDAAGTPVTRLPRPLVPALLIQPQPGFASADTLAIAFSRREHEFAYYQFASWTERPVRRLPRLLQQRLQARGVAAAVGVVGDPMRADWLLTIAIEALHHDARSDPGNARLALGAELYDRRSHRRAAQQRFDASEPLAQPGAGAAAQALSVCVARVFDALQPWLEAELQRLATPSGS